MSRPILRPGQPNSTTIGNTDLALQCSMPETCWDIYIMLFLNSCLPHEEGELSPKDTPYSIVNVQVLKLGISPQDFHNTTIY